MKIRMMAGFALAALLACPGGVTAAEQGDAAASKVVRYEDFGAKGDGKTDDFAAIVAAHEHANKHKLPVRADDNAEYYIGGANQTARIQTDTDFGKARFIIDDTAVENRGAPVFSVVSDQKSFKVDGVATLKKEQRKLDVKLPSSCLISVRDANVKRYIRYGINANDGAPQTDIFIVDKDGNVDMNAPIIWDFDKITEITALPMDEQTLTVTGGRFTTIANRMEGPHKYYNRGISVRRSNVVVDGIEHRVVETDKQSFPYSGFVNISDCANVTVKNSIFTGRKLYQTVKPNSKSTTTGTYDITANRALNVSFINCSQTNSILDRTYWGIMGSNFCKNLLFDGCKLSRFDAHMGVANATIRNSTLGYQGINAIGFGTLTVENSTVNGRFLVNLRNDYGSTWHGKCIIRDCVFIPSAGDKVSGSVIGGSNAGNHDFGYVCHMPEVIEISGLLIKDGNHPDQYNGPSLLADFNPKYKDASYKEEFPYVKTREIIVRDVKTESGKKWRLSDNPVMFRDVKVIKK
jgi:hypothetical protein